MVPVWLALVTTASGRSLVAQFSPRYSRSRSEQSHSYSLSNGSWLSRGERGVAVFCKSTRALGGAFSRRRMRSAWGLTPAYNYKRASWGDLFAEKSTAQGRALFINGEFAVVAAHTG